MCGMDEKKRSRIDDSVAEEAGLRFECVAGCTKCCEIPGLVFVHEKEIPEMAEHFELSPEEFEEKYLRRYWAQVFVLDFPEEEPCMFIGENGCEIYPVRPAQCRTFPFWPENINNTEKWKELMDFCPGIGKGKLFNIEEIISLMSEVCYGPFI